MKLTLLAAAFWVSQAQPAQPPPQPPPVPQLDQKRLEELGAEQVLPRDPAVPNKKRYRPIMLPDRQEDKRG